MKRILGILLLLILIGGFGGVVWKKDDIKNFLKQEKIISPLAKTPDVFELLAVLEKNGIPVSMPPILINGTIEATISGVTVLFSADKDFGTSVRSLQLVLPKSKMDSKQVKEIDLRFSKVVIRY